MDRKQAAANHFWIDAAREAHNGCIRAKSAPPDMQVGDENVARALHLGADFCSNFSYRTIEEHEGGLLISTEN